MLCNCSQVVENSSKLITKETNTLNEQDLENHKAYQLKGISNIENGDCEQALKDFQSAIKIDNTISEYFSDRARSYNCLGQFEKGIIDCKQAIILDSTNLYAHLNYSWALLHTNQFEKSLIHSQKVIQEDPNDKQLKAMAYNNKGNVLMMMKKDQAAIENLKKAVSINPENEEPFIGLGQIYVRMNEYSKAQINLEKALKLNNDSKEAIWALGLLNYKTGKIEEACGLLKKSINLGANYTYLNGETSETIYKKLCN